MRKTIHVIWQEEPKIFDYFSIIMFTWQRSLVSMCTFSSAWQRKNAMKRAALGWKGKPVKNRKSKSPNRWKLAITPPFIRRWITDPPSLVITNTDDVFLKRGIDFCFRRSDLYTYKVLGRVCFRVRGWVRVRGVVGGEFRVRGGVRARGGVRGRAGMEVGMRLRIW